MTDTTPDYAKMIDLINVLTVDRECDEEHDAKETCDKSAEAIRTLLESNKALVRERTNLIETKREQIGRLNKRIAELERERDQLRDKLHCMCGSPIDHSAWEGHTPVSVYDYSLDQERSRAEAAEAKLAEAMKVIEPFAAVAEHDIGDNATDDDIFWPISNARYTISGRLRVGHLRAARAYRDKERK